MKKIILALTLSLTLVGCSPRLCEPVVEVVKVYPPDQYLTPPVLPVFPEPTGDGDGVRNSDFVNYCAEVVNSLESCAAKIEGYRAWKNAR